MTGDGFYRPDHASDRSEDRVLAELRDLALSARKQLAGAEKLRLLLEGDEAPKAPSLDLDFTLHNLDAIEDWLIRAFKEHDVECHSWADGLTWLRKELEKDPAP